MGALSSWYRWMLITVIMASDLLSMWNIHDLLTDHPNKSYDMSFITSLKIHPTVFSSFLGSLPGPVLKGQTSTGIKQCIFQWLISSGLVQKQRVFNNLIIRHLIMITCISYENMVTTSGPNCINIAPLWTWEIRVTVNDGIHNTGYTDLNWSNINKFWIFKTFSFCTVSLEINHWNVHCFASANVRPCNRMAFGHRTCVGSRCHPSIVSWNLRPSLTTPGTKEV